MDKVSVCMAKLSGTRKALVAALDECVDRGRAGNRKTLIYEPTAVSHYFLTASNQISALRSLLPSLFSDFQEIDVIPGYEMNSTGSDLVKQKMFERSQLERLVRDIDQIFEIRANSFLEQPMERQSMENRVFITHGRSNDWREVQSFIEKDVGLLTMELAQEASLGRTIIEKLFDGADQCNCAVIVMTGDDFDQNGQARARENVMHEIGFFQAKYGRSGVCLLHEDGVSVPTNLSGVVYIPHPKGNVSAGFHVLARELKAILKF